MKEVEVVGTCVTNGRGKNCLQGFGKKKLKQRDSCEDLDVDDHQLYSPL
jgi:hypothetical protein